MRHPKILLVEDDENLGYILSEYLEMRDFNVEWRKDGEEGWRIFQKQHFDLCVLDVMMPRKDGFTLAEEIKEVDSDQPIIFLTARSLKIDKLKGFKIGCDDYIVKPVDEEELIARIQAIIKRTSADGDVIFDGEDDHSIGEYSFDYGKQLLDFKGEKSKLTEKENEILKLLCERKGEILERREALIALWGENDYFNRRSMDVFITKLRKILSKDPKIKISNVHGKGFILRDR